MEAIIGSIQVKEFRFNTFGPNFFCHWKKILEYFTR